MGKKKRLNSNVPVLGSVITDARLTLAWSREKLAGEAGVSTRAVFSAENGGPNDPDVVKKIAGALNLKSVTAPPAYAFRVWPWLMRALWGCRVCCSSAMRTR